LSRDISHMAIGIHPVAGTTWLFHGGSVKLGSVKGVFGLGSTWDGLNLSPFFWVGLVPFDVWLEG